MTTKAAQRIAWGSQTRLGFPPTAIWQGSALCCRGRGEGCLLWSFAYLAVRNVFALVWLLARPRRSKELEILVLRHELAMLRRQARQPKLTRPDRALLAALSRSLPRTAWAGFPVKPETLLRWHRQLVARRWTYARRPHGRPPLQSSLRALILRLGHENPHWGYKTHRRRTQGLGHLCVCDLGTQGAARRRNAASAGAEPVVVARVSARAGRKHACLRLPHC